MPVGQAAVAPREPRTLRSCRFVDHSVNSVEGGGPGGGLSGEEIETGELVIEEVLVSEEEEDESEDVENSSGDVHDKSVDKVLNHCHFVKSVFLIKL